MAEYVDAFLRRINKLNNQVQATAKAQQQTMAAEADAIAQISGAERTATRTDRYGNTVNVIVDGPMAGTIKGTEGILYEPPVNEFVPPTPTETTFRTPQGVAGQNVSVTPSGAITMAPSLPPAPTGPTLARDVFIQTLGQFFPGVDANASWLGDLYDVVSGYYKSGTTLDQSFNLALRDAKTNPKLATFANRFKGIADLEALKAQGKPITIPTIAEYVRSEASVADLLRQSNLGDIATPETIGSILGKGNSVSTIASKINQVFNRIDRAPQVIKDTLSRYFPTVDRNTLARTLLLGEKGVQQLQDELAGLEVLAAGEKQGIGATTARPGGLTQQRAQEYARAGISFAEAMPKFAEVARATPVEEKLAGISKKKSIGQAGVEQALVLGSAEELRKLEEAAVEERARFGAKPGRLEPGLASQRRANRAF